LSASSAATFRIRGSGERVRLAFLTLYTLIIISCILSPKVTEAKLWFGRRPLIADIVGKGGDGVVFCTSRCFSSILVTNVTLALIALMALNYFAIGLNTLLSFEIGLAGHPGWFA